MRCSIPRSRSMQQKVVGRTRGDAAVNEAHRQAERAFDCIGMRCRQGSGLSQHR